MGHAWDASGRAASFAARVLVEAVRAVGTAVLFVAGILDPISGGGWGDRGLALVVGAITLGLLALGFLLFGPWGGG